MSKRNPRRIDYNLLNSTGQTVEKIATAEISTELNQSQVTEMPSESVINIIVLIQEVEDTMDENPIETGADYQDVIQRLVEFRRSIRKNEQILLTETPDLMLTESIVNILTKMKDYIKEANQSKRKTQIVQTKQESDTVKRKEQSLLFSIKDSNNIIEELVMQFMRKPKDFSNEELMDMKSNLPSNVTVINEISKRLETISSVVTDDPTIQEAVQNLLERYDRLTLIKASYVKALNSVIDDRQIYKQKLFSESNLNIKLQKFSGYQDGIDIYTFKSKFEKLHLTTTPKHLLAELLKNNYLKEPG